MVELIDVLLKIQPTGFAKGLEMKYMCERRVYNDSKAFWPKQLKKGMAIY